MAISEQMYYDMARTVAKRYGYFIVLKPDAYLLYREAFKHNVFVGKRKRASGIYSLVKKCTGHK